DPVGPLEVWLCRGLARDNARRDVSRARRDRWRKFCKLERILRWLSKLIRPPGRAPKLLCNIDIGGHRCFVRYWSEQPSRPRPSEGRLRPAPTQHQRLRFHSSLAAQAPIRTSTAT